jgi:hypothetical protein
MRLRILFFSRIWPCLKAEDFTLGARIKRYLSSPIVLLLKRVLSQTSQRISRFADRIVRCLRKVGANEIAEILRVELNGSAQDSSMVAQIHGHAMPMSGPIHCKTTAYEFHSEPTLRTCKRYCPERADEKLT